MVLTIAFFAVSIVFVILAVIAYKKRIACLLLFQAST